MTPPAPERYMYTPDPVKQGELDVAAIESEATRTGKDVATEVENAVKKDIQTRESAAENVRNLDNKYEGQIPGDDSEAQNVAKTVSMFLEAVEKRYITPPPAGTPSRAVFDSLVSNLRRNINLRTAAYLQPLIDGLINVPGYVQITPTKTSRFEQDLKKIVAGFDKSPTQPDPVDNLMQRIFIGAAGPDLPPPLLTEIRNQLDASKAERVAEITARRKAAEKRSGGFSESERRYIDELFENDITPIALDIKGYEGEPGLLKAIETHQEFHAFYKRRYIDILDKMPAGEKDDMRARREATIYMHKCFMYLTHRIFSQVIEGAGHSNWAALNQATGRGYGVTAEQLFRHIRKNLSEIQHDVKLFGYFNFERDKDGKVIRDEHGKKEEIYYQLGAESIKQWETQKKGGETVYSEVREIPVISSELEQVHSFKEFIERFSNALGAERDLLEVGVNFNYLMATGHAEREGASFFQQAADYAAHSLGAGRIDELYRLPYNEIVHAARIQLANQIKRELAMNKWQKNPKLFSGIFQHANTAEHHALINMIKDQLGNEEDVPEWAIRRALLHARMHMSLISVDYHAISSYGHPYLTDDLKATFTDTAMPHLETFNTWWDATKWQTNELYRYGLAFMPRADRQWMHEVWLPADIQEEGEAIWKNSEHIGQMSLLGRRYFTTETPLNIMELNPMKVGGVEKQSGWGIKYPYTPWIDDLIDHPASQENFHMKNVHDLEYGWKRLENLGIEVLRNYTDTYLFGLNNKFLNLEDGKIKYEDHYKNLFSFIFERYFKEGVAHDANYGLSYRDEKLELKSFKYSDYKTGEEFWEKVVKPIINRPDIISPDDNDIKDPEVREKVIKDRNKNERLGVLKDIIKQSLGVLIFERLPVDMVFTEDPLRSQNGKTLLEELQEEFVSNEVVGHEHDGHEPPESHGHGGKLDPSTFEHVFADLDYVQGVARTKSIEKIKENLSLQRISNPGKKPEGFTTFGKAISEMGDLRSSIIISEAQKVRPDGTRLSPTGYYIDEHIVRDLLTEKYVRLMIDGNDPDTRNEHDVEHHVHLAVELYKAIRRKIIKKPDYSFYESHSEDLVKDDWAKREIKFEKQKGDLQPYEQTDDIVEAKKKEIQARLRKEFEDFRNNKMLTRVEWSGNHLLDPQIPITINDMAYPLMYFSTTGNLLVNRRLNQIAGTQEQYKVYIMGEYDSDLKKYYRKEDQGPLLEHIIGVRNRIKEWLGPEEYNGTSMFILENSMNVMRIRSDAENAIVEMQMRAEHKKRSAISGVATEGDEFPLRRQDRYKIVNEFMHSGQFPKHTDPKDRVYDVVENPRREKIKQFFEKFGRGMVVDNIGEMIANTADIFLGKDEAAVVRQAWKERSGNALRDRQIANVMNLVMREGPTLIVLVLAALMILTIVQGFKASEE